MDYTALARKEFPYQGEFFLSRNKKYEELIFFVHFYGGVKKQLLRHIRFVNQLGFDSFAFQLEGDHRTLLKLDPPLSSQGVFGLKHLYADQIELLLNLLPGSKIVYAFSNPSAAAIEAMARRHCSDTVALVCDSGPTAEFMPSVLKLFTYDLKVKPLPLRWALTPLFAFCWSPHLHKDLGPQLDNFPEGFRILSIRGWKDKLIPPAHIDEVFEPHKNLDWQKLSLPEADHLVGLRDFKEEYTPITEIFLKAVATPKRNS